MSVSPTTKRKMAAAFAQSLGLFAIATIPTWRRSPESWPSFLATLLAIPALFSLFPLILERNQRILAQRNQQRLLWREAYRHSPEASLLNLRS